MKIYCVSMVRNEGDFISYFLSRTASLFDRLFLVDVQSTDGTKEIIDAFARDNVGKTTTYNCRTQERYQSVIMNTLARKAFEEDADWVFLLDADEILAIEDRDKLIEYLSQCESDCIHLPWINLVPSEFGSFEIFNVGQEFYCSGKSAPVHKVAISSRYAVLNPDFYILEGNHDVASSLSSPPEEENPAFNILHIPVRSPERLKYKQNAAKRLLQSKHNAFRGEGHHVDTIRRRLAVNRVTPGLLSSIAANYSFNDAVNTELLPAKRNWPKRFLPSSASSTPSLLNLVRSLTETHRLDSKLNWEGANFLRGSPVCAEIMGSEILIRPQPMEGFRAFYGRYPSLTPDNASCLASFNKNSLNEIVRASFDAIRASREFVGSEFAPVLFSVISILRPRRFVALGLRSNDVFLTACDAVKSLKMSTQCVDVDTRVDGNGDEAGQLVKLKYFQRILGERFPQQHYIHGRLSDSLKCFDDSSIDLLYIDAPDSYYEIEERFEAWLPKLSSNGVVIFNNINLRTINSDMWLIWKDLASKYLHYEFKNDNGLGMLYVGKKPGVVAELFENIKNAPDLDRLLQLYFSRLSRFVDRGENTQTGNPGLQETTQELEKRNGAVSIGLRIVKKIILHSRFRNKLLPLAIKGQRYARAAKRLITKPIGKIYDDSRYVVFSAQRRVAERKTGLHEQVRLVIPTRGCSKWLPYFLKAYDVLGINPTYAVDQACETQTLEILKENNADIIFIDAAQIPNGESIMPYLSTHINEEYIFRLDDDEFPTMNIIDWVNSIPDSKYSFVTSWWLPRYEVALLDGSLQSFHPLHFRTKVGNMIYENLHGGRFYRHKDVTYGQVGAHHGNFISDYVSHAPPEALIIHLDYIVRTPEERLNKLRSVEARFPGAGWMFANHMIPEMAPRELQYLKKFFRPELKPLIDEILENVYQESDRLTLKTSEIVEIQKDRLTENKIHYHY